MGDMGMNHGSGEIDHGGMEDAATSGGAAPKAKPDAAMNMDGMKMRDTSLLPPDVEIGPGIDMVSMAPVDEMGDPGLGLRDVPHRVLNYRMLVARDAHVEAKEPRGCSNCTSPATWNAICGRSIGRMYSAISDVPIRFAWSERVRVKLINNTRWRTPSICMACTSRWSTASRPRCNRARTR